MASAQLGQNFLVNQNVADKIVRHFLPAAGSILEVGPGKGVLTDLLLKYAPDRTIKAVELDTRLFYRLREQYGGRVEVVNRNILKVSLSHLFPGEARIGLISNVPYYISRDFIDWVMSQAAYIRKGTLMLQKEFVDKLASRPDSKDYNAQSVLFNYLFRMKKEFDVSPGSFSPRPKVKSTVFSFEPAADPPADVKDFYLFLRSSFRNRRKTLINNLEKQYHTERLWAVFEDTGINPRIRAEQLTLDDFLTVFRHLK